jgi:hypothetical protein
MPFFYFHVIENGVEWPADEEGVEYPTLEDAERDAAATIARMLDGKELLAQRAVTIEIRTDKKQELARLTLTLAKDRTGEGHGFLHLHCEC